MPTSDTGMLSPGAVVVVPFPYSDRLAEKRRPALVVSGPQVAAAGLLWIVMITSARNPSASGDIAIADLRPTGLLVASVVRPHKIACIDPSRVVRRIGALASVEAEAAFSTLRALIGSA